MMVTYYLNVVLGLGTTLVGISNALRDIIVLFYDGGRSMFYIIYIYNIGNMYYEIKLQTGKNEAYEVRIGMTLITQL